MRRPQQVKEARPGRVSPVSSVKNAQVAAAKRNPIQKSSRAAAVSTALTEEVHLGSSRRPLASRRSILVSNLDPQALSRLARLGLKTTATTAGTLGPQIAKLELPPRLSIAAAQRLVGKIDARATSALDTYYYVQTTADESRDGGAVCAGMGCDARTLIGWVEPDDDEDDLCVSSPVIGLVDTRIDPSHAALAEQDIELLPPTGSGSDSDHGTAIASLLVGKAAAGTSGLLPRAKLVTVDAFSKGRSTDDRSDVLSLVRAIEALSARGVKVINLSLAGPPNPLLQRAIDAASKAGILIIAAAGNEGPASEPVYPAAYSGVIAVTAVDRNLAVYRRANRGDYVDIAAPGVEVPVASGASGVTLRSGTSYAAPFVAATAAALSVGRSAETVRALLNDAARDLGPPGRDPTFGWGLLQASAVCIKAPTPETPVEARLNRATVPPPAEGRSGSPE